MAEKSESKKKLTVAIAGARGFVGRALAEKLREDYYLIGLSRYVNEDENFQSQPWHELRKCDLYCFRETIEALQGVDIAFYLVHSMLPSARLMQGDFADYDLISADNFARAAKYCGVRQIIYLGGIVPPIKTLSKHLQSRLEVEKTLGGYGVPVTALRAAMVVGLRGSSFFILYQIIKKFSIVIYPSWLNHKTQPIALNDVLYLLNYCIDRKEVFAQSYDIGGPDILTYEEVIRKAAECLNLKRIFIRVPLIGTLWASLWVSLHAGAPMALVYPLARSLRHHTYSRKLNLQKQLNYQGMDFSTSIRNALLTESEEVPVAFSHVRHKGVRGVRSVQRIPLPTGRSAQWLALEYLKWLPRSLQLFLKVKVEEDEAVIHLCLRYPEIPIISFRYLRELSSSNLIIFSIAGGALIKPCDTGRIEFREISAAGCAIASVQDFKPALPWWLYSVTQAPLHLFVMWTFKKRMKQILARDQIHHKIEKMLN